MWGHKKFHRDFPADKKILDIGCGRKKMPGTVGLDCLPLPGVDIIADLNGPLPVENESFDIIYADQVLEHVQDLLSLMHEIFRILRPGGQLVAHTPYFRSSWAHIDPTHVRCFTINTLDYFVKGTLCHEDYRFSEEAFSGKQVFLDSDYPSTPLRALFSALALRWPGRYENSLLSFVYPFEQITYVLTK